MTKKIDYWYEHRAELPGLKGAVLKSAEKYRIDKSSRRNGSLVHDVFQKQKYMKIVLVIDSWNKGNGCIVVTHTLAKELQERGHEVSLVTTAGEEASNFNGTVSTVPGFYMPGVKEAMKNMNFLFGVGKKKVYRKAFKGADVVEITLPLFYGQERCEGSQGDEYPCHGSLSHPVPEHDRGHGQGQQKHG